MRNKSNGILSFDQVLTRSTVRRLAPASYFERGEDYFLEDAVVYLSKKDNTITATVQGTRRYKVRIKIVDDQLDYDCSCPLGDDKNFCKHCVAVCLQWISDQEGRGQNKTKEKLKTSENDIRRYLMKQDKKMLVDIISEQVYEDDQLREELIFKLNSSSRDSFNGEHFKRLIDRVVKPGVYVHYRQMWGYTRNIQSVVCEIEKYLEDGYAAEVIEIVEYALDQVEETLGQVDDSDGGIGMIFDDLMEIHLEACKKAKPNPKELAQRLFYKEISGQYDLFFGAVRTYADVLGKEGIQVYRQLAQKKWKFIPALKPGDCDDQMFERFHLTSIMEALAQQDNDIEQLVEVKSKNLSSAYRFLEIAQIYKDAGDNEKALEWAERGLKAFPEKIDFRLRNFLAEEYYSRGRHQESMDLIWQEFEECSRFEYYKKLQSHACKNDSWQIWREKAIQLLKRKKYSDVLVEIFIWEGDFDNAWQQAKAKGCLDHTWFKLAELRSKKHPDDAVNVYMNYVEPAVNRTNNQAYEEAVGYLKKIKYWMKKLDKEKEFEQYLRRLCDTYKRKKNFIKLVHQFKL